MTILKVIFAPRFGLIYQPERRRKLRIPVDYEGVRSEPYAAWSICARSKKGFLGSQRSRQVDKTLLFYSQPLSRRNLARVYNLKRPTAHDCACGFIDASSGCDDWQTRMH